MTAMVVGVGVGGVAPGRRVAVGGMGVEEGVGVAEGAMVAAAAKTNGLAVGNGSNRRTCNRSAWARKRARMTVKMTITANSTLADAVWVRELRDSFTMMADRVLSD